MNKLRSRSGETLMELLVAVLVGALSTLLLLTAVSAAGDLNRKALQSDQSFYRELTAAEAGQVLEGRTVTMTLSESGGAAASFSAQLQGAAAEPAAGGPAEEEGPAALSGLISYSVVQPDGEGEEP